MTIMDGVGQRPSASVDVGYGDGSEDGGDFIAPSADHAAIRWYEKLLGRVR